MHGRRVMLIWNTLNIQVDTWLKGKGAKCKYDFPLISFIRSYSKDLSCEMESYKRSNPLQWFR